MSIAGRIRSLQINLHGSKKFSRDLTQQYQPIAGLRTDSALVIKQGTGSRLPLVATFGSSPAVLEHLKERYESVNERWVW